MARNRNGTTTIRRNGKKLMRKDKPKAENIEARMKLLGGMEVIFSRMRPQGVRITFLIDGIPHADITCIGRSHISVVSNGPPDRITNLYQIHDTSEITLLCFDEKAVKPEVSIFYAMDSSDVEKALGEKIRKRKKETENENE